MNEKGDREGSCNYTERSGGSAGEFYTPPGPAWLIAHLLQPETEQTLYDPCCGSGGLLIKSQLRLRELHGKGAFLHCYGQEIKAATFAIARMNLVLHDMETELKVGNTMTGPAFTNPDGFLMTFDLVAANPMWNQDFPRHLR